MAEKAAWKKGQTKYQKSKQDSVKGNKTEVKYQNKKLYLLPNPKKKYKGQKGVKYQNNNFTKNLKKKKASDEKSFAVAFLTLVLYISSPLVILYIVDFEKFTKIRDGANYCLNKTVSLLPHAVVKQGELAVEYILPVADVTVNKLNGIINNTSTFFNTNPLIKDHWTNIREISSICSAHLVDYLRTLYIQTTGYCLDFKNKLF